MIGFVLAQGTRQMAYYSEFVQSKTVVKEKTIQMKNKSEREIF